MLHVAFAFHTNRYQISFKNQIFQPIIWNYGFIITP